MEIIIGIIIAGAVVAIGWGATAQSRRLRIGRERRGEIGYSGDSGVVGGGGSGGKRFDHDNGSGDSSSDGGGGGGGD